MLERWGSFSVVDHKATDALVTDVLAYDRLVFPVPPDQAERARWTANAWDPDLQDKRLQELGDRAIRVPWDQRRRDRFAKNWQRAQAVAADSQMLLPNSAYQATREVLALDPQRALPRGVTKATVVPAYHSADDLKKDYRISKAKRDDKLLSLLIRNRIAHPVFSDSPEENLTRAIQLSREPGFQEKRRNLYTWQEDMLARKVDPNRALEHLEELIDKYNSAITAAERNVTYRFLFTVAG